MFCMRNQENAFPIHIHLEVCLIQLYQLGIALRTTEYLGNETEYVPWSAASRELMFVSSMLQRYPLYGYYEVSLSIGPVMHKLLA